MDGDSVAELPGLAFFKIVWPRHILEFLKYLAFFKVYKVSIVKSQIFPFLKQEFVIFQLQAPGKCCAERRSAYWNSGTQAEAEGAGRRSEISGTRAQHWLWNVTELGTFGIF